MATYPAIANPSFTSSGVPFEYLYEGFSQEEAERAGNIVLMARCAWMDAGGFVIDALGYTDGSSAAVGSSYFRRVLPLRYPLSTNFYCESAALMSYPANSKSTVNQATPFYSQFFASDWAIYKLTFTRKPYLVYDDTTVNGYSTPELCRYTVRSIRPAIRERTINNSGGLEIIATGKKIPFTAFVTDYTEAYVYTMLQVPTNLIPWGAITTCGGKINSTSVVDYTYSPLGANGFSFPQDTLRFDGLATDVTPYIMQNGVWYADLPYMMSYRPGGWRKLPDPANSGALVDVKYSGIAPTKYLYDEADLNALFKPRAT